MEEPIAKDLLVRYANGSCTAEEKLLVNSWYLNQFEDSKKNYAFADPDYEEKEQAIWNAIQQDLQMAPALNTRPVKPLWPKFAAAAAAAVLIFVAASTFISLNKKSESRYALKQMENIKPGSNKAVLTLANGETIVLDDAENGTIASQSGVQITKGTGGQLIYRIAGTRSDTDKQTFNTIATPKGGQYQIILPDGTHVWLNSASSLTYPTFFSGTERKVELTGEAYFEVTKNKHLPFKVHSGKQDVEVLGTHFNINAYPDEPGIHTTLLEGAVKVYPSDHAETARLLSPGEQATFKPGKTGITVQKIDPQLAVAWKDGLFYFKDADVKSIMRSLSRWYNIEVTYDGKMPDRKFSGKIYRSVNAAQSLEILNYSDIHFKIEKTNSADVANKLTIIP